TVTPSADVAVPVAFGFHPYFRLPDVPRPEWWVGMPVREQLVLDAGMIPTGTRRAVASPPGPLRHPTSRDTFLPPTTLRIAGRGRRVEVRFVRGYPFAQVFAPPGASFICFEPMTAPANALGHGGPDLPLVEPRGRFAAEFAVRVTRATHPQRGAG